MRCIYFGFRVYVSEKGPTRLPEQSYLGEHYRLCLALLVIPSSNRRAQGSGYFLVLYWPGPDEWTRMGAEQGYMHTDLGGWLWCLYPKMAGVPLCVDSNPHSPETQCLIT